MQRQRGRLRQIFWLTGSALFVLGVVECVLQWGEYSANLAAFQNRELNLAVFEMDPFLQIRPKENAEFRINEDSFRGDSVVASEDAFTVFTHGINELCRSFAPEWWSAEGVSYRADYSHYLGPQARFEASISAARYSPFRRWLIPTLFSDRRIRAEQAPDPEDSRLVDWVLATCRPGAVAITAEFRTPMWALMVRAGISGIVSRVELALQCEGQLMGSYVVGLWPVKGGKPIGKPLTRASLDIGSVIAGKRRASVRFPDKVFAPAGSRFAVVLEVEATRGEENGTFLL